jgi:hypothetical protein
MKEAGFHHHLVKPARPYEVFHLLGERHRAPAPVD